MPRTHKSRYISTSPNKPQFYLAGIRDADRFAARAKVRKRLYPLRVEIEAKVAYYNRIARELQREDAVAAMARPLLITPLGVGIQVEAANHRSPLLDKSTSPEASPDEAPPDEAPPDESAAEESAAEEAPPEVRV